MGIALLLGGWNLIATIYLVSLIEALVYQRILRIKKTLEATLLANLPTIIMGVFLYSLA